MNTKFARAILATDHIASLIRGFSLTRLAVVENELPNSFTGSSDSGEVATEFNHDCDNASDSDINCVLVRVSDSEEKSYKWWRWGYRCMHVYLEGLGIARKD